MSNVIKLRRDFLPQNVFQMIEDFMHGDLVAIHIIGVSHDGNTVTTSAGSIPNEVKKNDTLKAETA